MHAAKKITSQMSFGSHVAKGRLRANQHHVSSSHQRHHSESSAHHMPAGGSHLAHRQHGHSESVARHVPAGSSHFVHRQHGHSESAARHVLADSNHLAHKQQGHHMTMHAATKRTPQTPVGNRDAVAKRGLRANQHHAESSS